MTKPRLHRGLHIVALLGGLALPVAGLAAGPAVPGAATHADTPMPAQQDFATPEEAAAALADAARAGNTDALMALFGPAGKGVIFSGDKYADAQSLHRFVDAYDAKHALVADGPERMTLDVGENDWPLPIPIVEANGRWHFDTAAGAEELINRRIGRNELAAIRVALTYVEAQKEYFDLMKAQTGTGFYAQRLVSMPGHHDGLYWPATAGAPESPFGPLVEQAQEEGYPGENVSGKPIPYQGYFFRILKEQGPDAPGGQKSYLRKDKLVGGYGLIAWPATYAVSGIMTFIVNQDGDVYQKDLGDKTTGRAARIFSFNPDLSWAHVQVTGQ